MSDTGKGIRMERKSFLISLAFIFALMAAAYVLTFIIPGGEFARAADADGNLRIDTSAGFTPVQGAFRSGNGCCPRCWY